MSELARTPSAEVDFLAALRVRGLALVAVGAFLGASGGFAASRLFLHHYEAHAVLRIATLGLMGPVVPLSEVRARAEARSLTLAALTAHSSPHPEADVNAYKVTADLDPSRSRWSAPATR